MTIIVFGLLDIMKRPGGYNREDDELGICSYLIFGLKPLAIFSPV